MGDADRQERRCLGAGCHLHAGGGSVIDGVDVTIAGGVTPTSSASSGTTQAACTWRCTGSCSSAACRRPHRTTAAARHKATSIRGAALTGAAPSFVFGSATVVADTVGGIATLGSGRRRCDAQDVLAAAAPPRRGSRRAGRGQLPSPALAPRPARWSQRGGADPARRDGAGPSQRRRRRSPTVIPIASPEWEPRARQPSAPTRPSTPPGMRSWPPISRDRATVFTSVHRPPAVPGRRTRSTLSLRVRWQARAPWPRLPPPRRLHRHLAEPAAGSLPAPGGLDIEAPQSR